MIRGTARSRPLEGGRVNVEHLLFITAATIGIVDLVGWVSGLSPSLFFAPAGFDFHSYLTAAQAWLSGDGFYHAYQLAGPYEVWTDKAEPILYPPTLLPILVPFTVLPELLWWVVPIGIVGWSVWRVRTPGRIALAVALLLFPTTLTIIWYGNPTLWIAAVLALATKWPAAAPFVLLKPSVFPLALFGIHRKAWWYGLIGLAIVSVPFAGLWLDWIRAVLNSRQDAGLLYSIITSPILLIPLVGALRTRH